MNNTIFKFPVGTEVECTLSKNRMFDNAVLKGTIAHYFKRPGHQTVLQHKEVKSYPVDVVHIDTKSGGFRVDVDCIITKPTQAIIDEIHKLAENAIKAKEKRVKVNTKPRKEYINKTTVKLGDGATIINLKNFVASKSSKIFHDAGSPTAKRISIENAVFFKTVKEAETSGRTHAK